jgi:hypothetical protein
MQEPLPYEELDQRVVGSEWFKTSWPLMSDVADHPEVRRLSPVIADALWQL